MDDKHTVLRKSLMENEKFEELGLATDRLSKYCLEVNNLHTSGAGPFFEAAFLKEVESAKTLGVETVAITYAVWQLTTEVPKTDSLFGRSKAIKALRAQVEDKGAKFGPSLDDYATRLCTQAHVGPRGKAA